MGAKMSKWQAIKDILLASNYIVLTDTTSKGSVSPLYADKFRQKLMIEHEGLQLVQVRHERMLDEIANREEIG
jgi:hypothetical protein